jgi:hypothetical protein
MEIQHNIAKNRTGEHQNENCRRLEGGSNELLTDPPRAEQNETGNVQDNGSPKTNLKFKFNGLVA